MISSASSLSRIDQPVYSDVSTPSSSLRWSFIYLLVTFFLWVFCGAEVANFARISRILLWSQTCSFLDWFNWIVQNHLQRQSGFNKCMSKCTVGHQIKTSCLFPVALPLCSIPNKRRAKPEYSLASQEPVNVFSHHFPLHFHVKPSLLCNGARIWKIATSKALLKAVAHAACCYVKLGLNVLPE